MQLAAGATALPLAWKPNVVLDAGAMAPLKPASVASWVLPLVVPLAFQMLVIC